MATTKPQPKNKPIVKNISDLKNKLTTEKAMEFIQKEKIKKEKIALDIFNESRAKIEKMGCAIGVKISLDNENRVIPQIVIIAQ